MKLRNKKTGEIMEFDAILPVKDVTGNSVAHLEYSSLAELNEEWEDYEEPAYYYFIQDDERIGCDAVEPYNHKSKMEEHKSIGNYFETREEAERAVECLRAWKRLKDKGFRFIEGYLDNNDDFIIKAKLGHVGLIDQPDVSLLFGGEE